MIPQIKLNVTYTVDELISVIIKQKGIETFLEETIKYVEALNPDNQKYLSKLTEDLKTAQRNYANRNK